MVIQNLWNFNNQFVNDYIKLMTESKIDLVEFGFRFSNYDLKYGKYAFTKESLFSQFKIPKKMTLGVMINSSDYLDNGKVDSKKLSFNFLEDSKESFISFVRIATHKEDFHGSLLLSSQLKKFGYKVGVNLMQIHQYKDLELRNFSIEANEEGIEYLYFADSMGSLLPKQVKKITEIFKEQFRNDVGIHAHNNLGLALANSIQAADSGIDIVDGTLSGMGRGAGNTLMEELIFYYKKLNQQTQKNIVDFLIKHFPQSSKTWGSNPFYFLSGIHNIHPSYVQELLEDKILDKNELISFILNLNENQKTSYDPKLKDLGSIFYDSKNNLKKSNLKNKIKSDFSCLLIVGGGDETLKYKYEIEAFIKKFQPLVLNLNTSSNIDQKFIDYFVFCNPERILSTKYINNKNMKVITPSVANDNFKYEKDVINQDIFVNKSSFIKNESFSSVPNSLAFTYALDISAKLTKSKIYLAGISGYKDNSNKNKELNKTILLFNNTYQNKLSSITSTELELQCENIFSLI